MFQPINCQRPPTFFNHSSCVVSHIWQSQLCHKWFHSTWCIFHCIPVFCFFLDAPAQPAVKEEVISRASSEQGEEEMEVESADEQEEDARSQSGQTNSQVSRSNSTGATFNTLSTLGSLRPGIYDTHFHHSTYLKGLSSQEHIHDSLLAL